MLLVSATVPEPADYVVDNANVLSEQARQLMFHLILFFYQIIIISSL